jgi:hypothetical protein
MTTEPYKRCYEHIRQATIFPCSKCLDAATRYREWKIKDDAKKAEVLKSVTHQRLLAITACRLCDDTGYAQGALCRHDPAAQGRAQRGAALARANLTTTGGTK